MPRPWSLRDARRGSTDPTGSARPDRSWPQHRILVVHTAAHAEQVRDVRAALAGHPVVALEVPDDIDITTGPNPVADAMAADPLIGIVMPYGLAAREVARAALAESDTVLGLTEIDQVRRVVEGEVVIDIRGSRRMYSRGAALHASLAAVPLRWGPGTCRLVLLSGSSATSSSAGWAESLAQELRTDRRVAGVVALGLGSGAVGVDLVAGAADVGRIQAWFDNGFLSSATHVLADEAAAADLPESVWVSPSSGVRRRVAVIGEGQDLTFVPGRSQTPFLPLVVPVGLRAAPTIAGHRPTLHIGREAVAPTTGDIDLELLDPWLQPGTAALAGSVVVHPGANQTDVAVSLPLLVAAGVGADIRGITSEQSLPWSPPAGTHLPEHIRTWHHGAASLQALSGFLGEV